MFLKIRLRFLKIIVELSHGILNIRIAFIMLAERCYSSSVLSIKEHRGIDGRLGRNILTI